MDISFLTEEQRAFIEDKFAALLASKAKACPSNGFKDLDFSPFLPLDILDGTYKGMTYLSHWREMNGRPGNNDADPFIFEPDFVYDESPNGTIDWDKVYFFDLKTWRAHPRIVHLVQWRLYEHRKGHREENGLRWANLDMNRMNDFWLEEEFGGFGQRLAAQLSLFKREALNAFNKKCEPEATKLPRM